MHVCATEVLNFEEPRLQTLLLHGQQGPIPTAASLSEKSLNASVTLLLRRLQGLRLVCHGVQGLKKKKHAGGAQGRGFTYRGSTYGMLFP